MKRDTFGAIDIGSNAIRLLINYIEDYEDGHVEYKKAAFVRVPIRLGDDAFLRGHISSAKIEALCDAMQGFSALLRAFGTHDYRACATSAMREASNGGQIAELVRSCSGISIEIINGETEADTIFAAGGLKETLDPQKPISTSMSEAVVPRSLSTPAVARSRPARSDWGPCVSSAAQRPRPNGCISRNGSVRWPGHGTLRESSVREEISTKPTNFLKRSPVSASMPRS